jgi:hypothetical protein
MRVWTYTVGSILAALGAIWLLASLFMPWYRPEIGGLDHPNFYGLIFVFGESPGNGWQTLSFIDIYLAVLAAVTIAACVLSARGFRKNLFVVTGMVALVGVGLIVYRLIEPAVQIEEGAYFNRLITGETPTFSMQPKVGIFVALASAIAILLGSILADFHSWRAFRLPGMTRHSSPPIDRRPRGV